MVIIYSLKRSEITTLRNVFCPKETIKVKYKAQTVLSNYDKILNKLISLNNIEDKVLTLMDARNEINFNLNLNLLTYSTFNKIFGN